MPRVLELCFRGEVVGVADQPKALMSTVHELALHARDEVGQSVTVIFHDVDGFTEEKHLGAELALNLRRAA